MKKCLNCHADPACYNSLGQLLTAKPTSSAQRFKGGSLLEKEGLWQRYTRPGREEGPLNQPFCQAPEPWHRKQSDGLRLAGFSGGNYFLLQQKKQEGKILPAECSAEILEGVSSLLLSATGPSNRKPGA